MFAGKLLLSVVCTTVDMIETNHQYDQQGRLTYDQAIFWELDPATRKYRVRAWAMLDDRDVLNRRPVKNEITGLWQVDWFDTDKRIMRKITSRQHHESWTQKDPEVANKKVWP